MLSVAKGKFYQGGIFPLALLTENLKRRLSLMLIPVNKIQNLSNAR
jgi:hypothetical protein